MLSAVSGTQGYPRIPSGKNYTSAPHQNYLRAWHVGSFNNCQIIFIARVAPIRCIIDEVSVLHQTSKFASHAKAAIVLLFGIAAFWVFQSVKFNDNSFFREAIVIFCTQCPCAIFYQNKRRISIPVPAFSFSARLFPGHLHLFPAAF